MLPYAVTVFCGAFLLFAVQPMMGRFVLPWYGGAPGVWAVCLGFYQTALLAGYGYAHVLTQRVLSPRRQMIWHALLLLTACATLPPLPPDTWQPDPTRNPTGELLVLLVRQLGIPFMLIAATGPLLQRWFAVTHPGRSPYRLFALSNAGSLATLLAYPLLIERMLTRGQQALAWSAGVVGLLALVGWTARKTMIAAVTSPEALNPSRPAPGVRVRWVLYPALAAALLSATSTRLTLDVPAGPFMWVMPLGLYLISFILCFDHPRWYRRTLWTGLGTAAAVVTADLLVSGKVVGWGQQMMAYNAALLAAGMICHGEVYRLRPAAEQLTRYYLHLAAGGALGGLVIAIVAPLVFDHHYDLQILWTGGLVLLAYESLRQRDLARVRASVLGLAGGSGAVWLSHLRSPPVPGFGSEPMLVSPATVAVAALAMMTAAFIDPRRGWVRGWQWRVGAVAVLIPLGFAGWQARVLRGRLTHETHASRNFHGTLVVQDFNRASPMAHCRFLTHGSTIHGLQLLHPDYRRWPTAYYGPTTGMGLALARPNQPPARRIGVIGLGVGTLAAYGQAGDAFHFHELDPAVAQAARAHFTYLDDSPAVSTVTIGDGRLGLAAEEAAGAPRYDTLVVDAFTSDAVPTHLLTREAFALYFSRLAPGGVLAINTSNHYVNLPAVVLAQARAAGWTAVLIEAPADPEEWWAIDSAWMLLAREPAALATPAILEAAAGTVRPAPLDAPLWTDDRVDLWSAVY